MEELLIVVFQFVLETLLEALAYWPFETAADRMLGARSKDAPRAAFLLSVALIAGGVVGVISLIAWPHTWLRTPALRIANLVIAPLISAGSAWLFASRRAPQPTHSPPSAHALFGFTFTLVFVLVRFTEGVH